MPNVFDLGQRVKAKYPGAYDDVADDELGRRVKAKYPGAYDNFEDAPSTQPSLTARVGQAFQEYADTTLVTHAALAGLAGEAASAVAGSAPARALATLAPPAHQPDPWRQLEQAGRRLAGNAIQNAGAAVFAGANDVAEGHGKDLATQGNAVRQLFGQAPVESPGPAEGRNVGSAQAARERQAATATRQFQEANAQGFQEARTAAENRQPEQEIAQADPVTRGLLAGMGVKAARGPGGPLGRLRGAGVTGRETTSLGMDLLELTTRTGQAINARRMADLEGADVSEQASRAWDALIHGNGPNGVEIVKKGREVNGPSGLYQLLGDFFGEDGQFAADAIEGVGRDALMPNPVPVVGTLTRAGRAAREVREGARMTALMAKVGEKTPEEIKAILEATKAPSLASQFANGERQLIGIDPGVLGAKSFALPGLRYPGKGVGTLADLAKQAIERSPGAQNIARSLRLERWLPQAEQDARVMSYFTAKEKAAIADTLKNDFLAGRETMRGSADFDKAYQKGGDASHNLDLVDAFEKGSPDDLEARIVQAMSDKRITSDQGQYLRDVKVKFDGLIKAEQEAGIQIAGLSNADYTYLTHVMTKEALDELASRYPLATPSQRTARFMAELKAKASKIDKTFGQKRMIDLSTTEANQYARDVMGLKAPLFHTDVPTIVLARSLASTEATTARDLIGRIGSHLGYDVGPGVMKGLEKFGAGPMPVAVAKVVAERRKEFADAHQAVWATIEADPVRFFGGVLAEADASRLLKEARGAGREASRQSRKVYDLHSRLGELELRYGVDPVTARNALDLGEIKQRIARLKGEGLAKVGADPIRAWEAASGKPGAVERSLERSGITGQLTALERQANELERSVGKSIESMIPRAYASDRVVQQAVEDVFHLEAAPNLEKMMSAEARIQAKAGRLGVEVPPDMRQQAAIEAGATLPRTPLRAFEQSLANIEERLGRAATTGAEQERRFSELTSAYAAQRSAALEAYHGVGVVAKDERMARRVLREAKASARRELGVVFEGGQAIPALEERFAIASDKALKAADELDGVRRVGEDFVVVREGQLAGKALPSSVHDMVTELGKATAPQAWRMYGRMLSGYTKWWKSWTLFGPDFHMRNMVGNLLNNHLADVNNPADYHLALKTMLEHPDRLASHVITLKDGTKTNLSEMVAEMKRTGVDKTQFSTSFERVREQALKEEKGLSALGSLPLVGTDPSQNALLRANAAVGDFVEGHARRTHYLAKRMAGMTPEQAALSVKRYLFDYSEMSPLERDILLPLIPFYGFLKNNFSLQLSEFVQQPAKYARLERVLRNADDPNAPPAEYYDEWMQRAGVRRTGAMQNGIARAYTTGGYSTMWDVARLGAEGNAVTEGLHPIVKAFLPLVLGRDFRGRRIEGSEKTAPGQDSRRTDWAGGDVPVPAATTLDAVAPGIVGKFIRVNPGNILGTSGKVWTDKGERYEGPGTPARFNLLADVLQLPVDDAQTRSRRDVPGGLRALQATTGMRPYDSDISGNARRFILEDRSAGEQALRDAARARQRGNTREATRLEAEGKALLQRAQGIIGDAKRRGIPLDPAVLRGQMAPPPY